MGHGRGLGRGLVWYALLLPIAAAEAAVVPGAEARLLRRLWQIQPISVLSASLAVRRESGACSANNVVTTRTGQVNSSKHLQKGLCEQIVRNCALTS